MNIENEVCEALEEFLILGDVLSPSYDEHASNCERCQGTITMTKSIETELEAVPEYPASKPLWIRELHARQTRAQRHRRWALGGMVLATAATVLALAGPRFFYQESPEPTHQASVESTNDRNTQRDKAATQEAPSVKQSGAEHLRNT